MAALSWRRFLRRLPPVTTALLVVCVAYTLVVRWAGWPPEQAGAIRESDLWNGELWRLATATFLHSPSFLLHVVLNGLSLFFVGRVIERGLGRRDYLVALFGSALAGFAASMIFADDDYPRVGISGGIAGLLGVLLAVEWCFTSSWREFLGQRNTKLILFFVALSVPLGMWLETDTIKVDHAAHAGGFAFGLLAGLAYYARPRRRRPVRGAAAVLVLGVLPVLLVSYYPFWDVRWFAWRGERAFRAGERDEAERYYAHALLLDPDLLPARVRLAELRDDPELLRGLRPRGEADAYAVLGAYLGLAGRRLGHDPAAARAVMLDALTVEPASAELWMEFAQAAEGHDLHDVAYRAYRLAADWYRRTDRWSEQWRPAVGALRALVQSPLWREAGTPAERIAREVEAAQLARDAVGGLAGDFPEEQRRALEDLLGRVVADRLAAGALDLTGKEEQAGDLYGLLADLYRILANNATVEARRADYRYRSAFWLWRLKGPDEEVRARFNGALQEARELGDAKTQAAAEQWFEARGLPVPPPDLDGSGDGG